MCAWTADLPICHKLLARCPSVRFELAVEYYQGPGRYETDDYYTNGPVDIV